MGIFVADSKGSVAEPTAADHCAYPIRQRVAFGRLADRIGVETAIMVFVVIPPKVPILREGSGAGRIRTLVPGPERHVALSGSAMQAQRLIWLAPEVAFTACPDLTTVVTGDCSGRRCRAIGSYVIWQ